MAGLGCHGGSARIAQSWLGLSVLLPWPWSLGDCIFLWTDPCSRLRCPNRLISEPSVTGLEKKATKLQRLVTKRCDFEI